jgi:pyruvate,water dikinase
LAGGKAASLGALLRAGFQVPGGFVVITTEDDLNGLRPAILEKFDAMSVKFVAVRSSAVHEDGSKAAWAGQLDTFLNVPRRQLLECIGRCMASSGSDRAQAYGAHHGGTAGAVAVIVQAMLDSDVSGVAFSAHPVTGSREHLVIEAALGLGESVVSGEVTPDTYIIEAKSGKIIEASIAAQTKQLVRSLTGGNEWQSVQPPIRSPKLIPAQLAELADTVRRLADFFGHPVDVEWAYAGGELYILQSRPITTL